MKTTRSTSRSRKPSSRHATHEPARKAPKATTRAPAKARPKAKAPAASKPRAKRARKPSVSASDVSRVHEVLAGFRTVMLVTAERADDATTLRARPMSVAQLGDDCSLTFMTSLDTAKVGEAARSTVSHVVAQGRTTFVSLAGEVEVVTDRARIHAAWSPADKVYFPKGEDDPNIGLLVFRPKEAELWDLSGSKGVRFLFEAARALLSGERPLRDASGDTHERVTLGA